MQRHYVADGISWQVLCYKVCSACPCKLSVRSEAAHVFYWFGRPGSSGLPMPVTGLGTLDYGPSQLG
jgi:hypothetical protein